MLGSAYHLCMTKKPGRSQTVDGKPVTQEMIQAWADEAEVGYDPAALVEVKRGRPTIGSGNAVPVSVRFEPELNVLLDAAAARQHVNKSDLIREAVRQYLHAS